MFHSYFERKNNKVLTFNIVHFPNVEISASLYLAPPSNKRRTSQFQNLKNTGGAHKRKYGIHLCGTKHMKSDRDFWISFGQ